MTHFVPDPETLAKGDQLAAGAAEQLKYMRMWRAGTLREHGDYVGTGIVITRFIEDEARVSRTSLARMLNAAMAQLDAAGINPDALP